MDKLPISRGLSWRMEAAQYDGEELTVYPTRQASLFHSSWKVTSRTNKAMSSRVKMSIGVMWK